MRRSASRSASSRCRCSMRLCASRARRSSTRRVPSSGRCGSLQCVEKTPSTVPSRATRGVDCTDCTPAASSTDSAGVPRKMGLVETSSTRTRRRSRRADSQAVGAPSPRTAKCSRKGRSKPRCAMSRSSPEEASTTCTSPILAPAISMAVSTMASSRVGRASWLTRRMLSSCSRERAAFSAASLRRRERRPAFRPATSPSPGKMRPSKRGRRALGGNAIFRTRISSACATLNTAGPYSRAVGLIPAARSRGRAEPEPGQQARAAAQDRGQAACGDRDGFPRPGHSPAMTRAPPVSPPPRPPFSRP